MTYWKVQHRALMMKSDELTIMTTVAGEDNFQKKMPVCKCVVCTEDVAVAEMCVARSFVLLGVYSAGSDQTSAHSRTDALTLASTREGGGGQNK